MLRSTYVYIDGFNLYYGCLKGSNAYKWLDLEKLSSFLWGDLKIKQIRYFTARIKGFRDQSGPKRQNMYLRALDTNPKIDIQYGKFLVYSSWYPLDTENIKTDPDFVKVKRPEEKGSDVNLATAMLMDAFKKDCDSVALITNDSDLVTPLKYIKTEFELPIFLANPQLRNRHSNELKSYASHYQSIRRWMLKRSQLPTILEDENGTIRKPQEWM